jgi:hypothetical protein
MRVWLRRSTAALLAERARLVRLPQVQVLVNLLEADVYYVAELWRSRREL